MKIAVHKTQNKGIQFGIILNEIEDKIQVLAFMLDAPHTTIQFNYWKKDDCDLFDNHTKFYHTYSNEIQQQIDTANRLIRQGERFEQVRALLGIPDRMVVD